MKKYFANYNQSLALEELGFDRPCLMYIHDKEYLINDDTPEWIGAVKCPLKSQVFDWFRKEHKIFPEVLTDCTAEPKFCFTYNMFFGNEKDLASEEWGWINNISQYSLLYKTYEEAESACIDELIKIIKDEKNI